MTSTLARKGKEMGVRDGACVQVMGDGWVGQGNKSMGRLCSFKAAADVQNGEDA